MDPATVAVYEERGLEWAARRRPVRRAQARAFAKRLEVGELRVDVGCGAGRYTGDLGTPVVGLDASRRMLEQCRRQVPGALLVEADLEALPFARRCVGGAWANMSYLHIPSTRLPMALADLHRVLRPGAPVDVQVLHGDYEGDALPEDDVGGRFFASWEPDALFDVFVGAGFDVHACEVDDDVVRVRAERVRTLSDTVGPGMALLVVGLNPSLYAADAGVPFARPGNRFWPAALAAGVVSRDRDPYHALAVHGVGMTDLVKRATVGADELAAPEYRRGLERVDRLVRWLRPAALCLVGLAGWRAAVDRTARPGRQETRLGGRPVYLMPSTSGANAHARPEELAEHLRATVVLASSVRASSVRASSVRASSVRASSVRDERTRGTEGRSRARSPAPAGPPDGPGTALL